MHSNVKRCLHKLILIAVAIHVEAAMLEDTMTSRENALLSDVLKQKKLSPFTKFNFSMSADQTRAQCYISFYLHLPIRASKVKI